MGARVIGAGEDTPSRTRDPPASGPLPLRHPAERAIARLPRLAVGLMADSVELPPPEHAGID